MLSVAAIIPAAGSGTRMGLGHPKQYHHLHDAPILIHTLRAFVAVPLINRIVVVVPEDRLAETSQLLTEYQLASAAITVTAGGRRRQDSVLAGMKCLTDTTDIILVHDGARPLVTPDLIQRCIEAAEEHGAAIAAIPVKDTLKRGHPDGTIAATVDRKELWQAQTPQAVRFSLLKEAYATSGDRDVTDEAALLELAGIAVTLVEGSETNIKITRPDDLILADKIMQIPSSSPTLRIGHGYDAHCLVVGRELVLAGVRIPHDLGLAGHSDADVVTHALCDAVLGALGAGDIGHHFPDSDQRFKDIYSIRLLEEVLELAVRKGFVLSNGDITIICQAPKLAPHIDAMRTTLAQACRVSVEQINLKATTTEKMGFTGREEGISCHAVVLLTRK